MAFSLGKLLRDLVTSKRGEDLPEELADETEYKGYAIRPAPRREGAQWRTAGVITKRFEDEAKEHRFIRAETHRSKDEAAAFSVTKAKQIIDDFGDRMFDKG